jgi:hypothetical protein
MPGARARTRDPTVVRVRAVKWRTAARLLLGCARHEVAAAPAAGAPTPESDRARKAALKRARRWAALAAALALPDAGYAKVTIVCECLCDAWRAATTRTTCHS